MRPRIPFSITLKFVLTAAVIVALSTATWGWWAWQNEQRLLYGSLRDQGKLMMTSLATPIINALLYEEMGVIEEGGLLDNFVEEIMNNSTFPAVYAYVTDPEGKVLAHNRYAEHGKMYSDPLTREALTGRTFACRLTNTGDSRPPADRPPSEGSVLTGFLWGHGDDDAILDMAMPLRIHGKSWGALRIGVSTVPLEQQLSALTRRIVTFAGLFFLTCTGVFYIVGLNLARPLVQLSDAMSEVQPENLDARLPAGRRDEIGLLQGSFRDMIQRLRKSEEERSRVVEELIRSEKLATIGKIVAGVAHEINNPLTALSACVYNMEPKMPEDLRKYTDILKSGSHRIETIVRQLTDFSRAGDLTLHAVESDLFFKEAAAFGSMALKKHGVYFTATDSVPPTLLTIDKGKMHQVVLNLLMNAAEASPRGGTVEFLAYRHADSYYLAVKDQGKGILVEERERIFEIFHTTKPPGEGTGIGLAICKNIVEMHHGSIFFESKPGETIFVVKIPLKRVSP